jgi:hypothetical protein
MDILINYNCFARLDLIEAMQNLLYLPLRMDDATLLAIRAWKVSGTDDDKRFVLIAYLLELVYDLMIAPGDNVSLNARFEQCHGQVSLD